MYTWVRRLRLRARVLLAAVAAALIVPATVFAVQIDYAQGYNGVGGGWQTPGIAARGYNQVWHHAGSQWEVYYSDGSGLVVNTLNPTRFPNASFGAVHSDCQNDNDASSVLWTCQTTKP
jgi:hypothetical protein